MYSCLPYILVTQNQNIFATLFCIYLYHVAVCKLSKGFPSIDRHVAFASVYIYRYHVKKKGMQRNLLRLYAVSLAPFYVLLGAFVKNISEIVSVQFPVSARI